MCHARGPVTAEIIIERSGEGGHAGESAGLGAEGFEKRYGKRAITREIQAVAVAAVTLEFWVRMRAPTEDHKLLRVLHRQRTQKYRVDETENYGVGADAERESENDNDREARRMCESAYRVADILKQLLEPNKTPHLARFFFHPRYIPKFAQRREARFFRRHPARDVVLRLRLDVLADAFFEILHHALAFFHHSPSCSAGRRIRAIAPAIHLCKKLFVSQRNHGVHFRCPPRRNVASQQRCPDEEQCHTAESHRIGGRHAKKQ